MFKKDNAEYNNLWKFPNMKSILELKLQAVNTIPQVA